MALTARMVTIDCADPAEHGTGDHAWTVLADPDGTEFCVAEQG